MPQLPFAEPPESLMIELREVAVDAGKLIESISKANNLSEKFPSEQIVEMLQALRSLPDGTSEGCRAPLEYARARLPAIRRNFIQPDRKESSITNDADYCPSLTRGMLIDQRLGSLVSSVTTALDEYRALASIESDPTDTAFSVVIDHNESNTISAVQAAKVAEERLIQGKAEINKLTVDESKNADQLKRQMHDARALFGIARIELRMPEFVPKWYQKTINAVSNYPKILQKTAKAIQIGVDVAHPLADAWSHYQHHFKKLILETISQAAKDLEAVGKRWEQERNKNRSIGGDQTEEPPPGEFNTRDLYRMILAGKSPIPTWVPNVKVLKFKNSLLSDLSPLRELTCLQRLEVVSAEVQDLEPISKLHSLISLDLTDTKVSDLSYLSTLNNLRMLKIAGTLVVDLSPLEGLNELEHLDLSGTKIEDFGPLSRLENLRVLDLDYTKIEDLSPIENLSELRTLDLKGTNVSDLDVLSSLQQLEWLDLSGTKVESLVPLKHLREKLVVYAESEIRIRQLQSTVRDDWSGLSLKVR